MEELDAQVVNKLIGFLVLEELVENGTDGFVDVLGCVKVIFIQVYHSYNEINFFSTCCTTIADNMLKRNVYKKIRLE